MKKFSDFNKYKKVNEQDETPKRQDDQNPSDTASLVTSKANLPENIEQSEESDDKKEETTGIAGFDGNPAKFFSKLFESREMAHVYHLQVKGDEGSYSKHMALDTYYKDIVELIDDCIEVYQGQYGIIEGYDIIDTKETKTKEPVAYFEDLAGFIKESRRSISPNDTHIHSIIDDIVCLIYKTLYKLKFNK